MSFLPGPRVDRVRGKAPRSPTPRFSTAPPPHPASRSHDRLELMPGSLPAGWPETQPTSCTLTRGVAVCQHLAPRAPADEGSEVNWTRAPPGRAAGISPDTSAGVVCFGTLELQISGNADSNRNEAIL